MQFEGIVSDLGDVVLVVLEGEVDMQTAPQFESLVEDALQRAQSRTVVLGCEGLTFMDSQGLGVLIRAHKQAAANGTSLELRSLPLTLRRTMEIAGLTSLLRVRD